MPSNFFVGPIFCPLFSILCAHGAMPPCTRSHPDEMKLPRFGFDVKAQVWILIDLLHHLQNIFRINKALSKERSDVHKTVVVWVGVKWSTISFLKYYFSSLDNVFVGYSLKLEHFNPGNFRSYGRNRRQRIKRRGKWSCVLTITNRAISKDIFDWEGVWPKEESKSDWSSIGGLNWSELFLCVPVYEAKMNECLSSTVTGSASLR